MSFFGRVLLTAAVVAGVAHVFRRDLGRILGALQKPTEKFIKEVQKELDVQKAAGSSGTLLSGGGSGSSAAEAASAAAKSAAGAQAAADVAAPSGSSAGAAGAGAAAPAAAAPAAAAAAPEGVKEGGPSPPLQ
jgi:hypothetical protein